MIVEPVGSTWQTDENSRASATVKLPDGSKFREFVTIVQDDVASLAFYSPAKPPVQTGGGTTPTGNTLQIDGAAANGSVNWVLNGTTLSNNSTIKIQPGDTITFAVQSGTHGITFLNKADAEKVFDFSTPGQPFVAQPTIGPNAWGTAGNPAGTTLATLKVRSDIPASLTSLNFECTVHKQNMAGVFQIGEAEQALQIDGAAANGQLNWVLNGTALPNNSKITIKPGDKITFAVQSGTHGITFLNKADAMKVFDFSTPGQPFKDQPSIGPNAWGTDGNPAGTTLATLFVKSNLPAGLTSVNFECTVHKQNMAGVFQLDDGGATLQIDGAVVSGQVKWELNGTPLDNNSTIPIKPGDTIVFGVKSGTHGITFLDKAQSEAVFNFGSSASNFKPQPSIGPNAWGTDGAGPGTTLATLKVRGDIPPSLISLNFECTVHKQNMAGVFQISGSGPVNPGTTTPVPSNWTQALNYRTEPLGYRFAKNDWLASSNSNAPLGISRALSNTLVLADPQTPVFAASAGMPIRMRLLHPAGLNEQVYTLHGHVWQEEPYKNNSTVIGDNPKSQNFGARDSFGPNVSWDLVAKKAGGEKGVPGDYLYRTFIGTDFMFGLWGVLRVGEPGKDIVTMTSFGPLAGKVVITGVNTVNPDNGQMAEEVTIHSGTGPDGPVLGTAKVDRMTGMWSFTGTNIAAPITAVSSQGGSVVATAFIQRIFDLNPAPAVVPVLPSDEIFRFKPKPRVIREQ